MKNLKLFALLLLMIPSIASAWWNADWTSRKKISINLPTAVAPSEAQVVVPLRLHTGNFIFTDAQQNGADLRFVSGDDKTPLNFHIERFDDINELAIIWLQLPKPVAGAAPATIWMYYGNEKATAGENSKTTFDANQTMVLHLSDKDGVPKDASANANLPAEATAARSLTALLGGGARFDGKSVLLYPATTGLKLSPTGGFTFSAWIKATAGQTDGVLFSQVDGTKSLTISLVDGKIAARVVDGKGGEFALPPTAALEAGAWHHLAVTAQDKLVVYIDGKPAATADMTMTDLAGTVAIGATTSRESGFSGEMDEITLSNSARSAGWIALAQASQNVDTLLKVGEPEAGEAAEAEGESYFATILQSVTLDGWVVIGILMVMMAIAFWVMIAKTYSILRLERANAYFRGRFKQLSGELISMDVGSVDDDELGPDTIPANSAVPTGHTSTQDKEDADHFRHSSLYRVYHVGVRELHHRFDLYDKAGQSRNLTPQAISAIRASVDAGLVREMQKLNSNIVLLTIAISGGPFLGLLGTVVGVMITFAAIAAAGDVNVNAIAPGIAAALVATVAGLAVAIPALFGYNYLSSRIKNASSDMQVFVDEFITKLAEDYSL